MDSPHFLPAPVSPSRVAGVFALCAAAFALDLYAWWPGQVSFDAAYAWWQAQGGASTTIVPPAFVLALKACGALGGGPGLLLAFHSALFWTGCGAAALALRWRFAHAAAVVLVLALAPVAWLLRGHVWTDVGLFSSLVFATGMLALAASSRRSLPLAAALPALLYAAALCHNALLAVLPFLAWWTWLAGRRLRPSMSPRQAVLPALAIVLATVGMVRSLDGLVDRRIPLWPSLAQYDLAAVSVARGRMLLPEFMIGPGLEVAELAAAFRDWSNLPMLHGTRHGMRAPFDAFRPEEFAVLRAAWIGAVLHEPAAWLGHRWRLTRNLVGTHGADWPVELVFAPGWARYGDEPRPPGNGTALHRWLLQAAGALRATPALAAWPYLLAGLAVLPVALRRRREPRGRLALLLLASAWLYGLTLALLAPSAELRYLGWPCVASLFAFAAAWIPVNAAAVPPGPAGAA
ncbi:MAG: hypothetical protein J0H15_10095 [Xanthomonadales bacterium]|nr:hypothetical protein [Xanthomonadales bacterium]